MLLGLSLMHTRGFHENQIKCFSTSLCSHMQNSRRVSIPDILKDDGDILDGWSEGGGVGGEKHTHLTLTTCALLICHTLPNPSVSSGSARLFWRQPTHLEARGSLHLSHCIWILSLTCQPSTHHTVLKAHPDLGLEGQTKSGSKNAYAYVHTLSQLMSELQCMCGNKWISWKQEHYKLMCSVLVILPNWLMCSQEWRKIQKRKKRSD